MDGEEGVGVGVESRVGSLNVPRIKMCKEGSLVTRSHDVGSIGDGRMALRRGVGKRKKKKSKKEKKGLINPKLLNRNTTGRWFKWVSCFGFLSLCDI